VTGLGTVPPEAWMAAGYCLLAVALAHVIDGLARRAATTAEGGTTASGFVYHPSHDAWTCPTDEWLWPESFDPANRVLRYRANPTVCNACPVRRDCTTSTTGREVQRAVDAWPASEAARFHRWIACTVALLGLVWPLATIASGVDRPTLVVLGGAVALAVVTSLPLWSHLRRSVVELPPGMAVRTVDDVVADRQAVELGIARRRARYASDSRPTQGDPA
jgi:hypothetical protein